MKKTLILIGCLVALTCFAQVTIKMIFQYPNNPTPPLSDLVLLDQGNGTYEQASLFQIQQLISPTLGNFAILTAPNVFSARNTFTFPTVSESWQSLPNAFPGPTNSMDMNLQTLVYTALTSCSINVLSNVSTLYEQTSTLTIRNSSGSNTTFTLPPSVESRDGLRSYTMTNAQDFIISIRTNPLLGRTNSVQCPNF